MRTLFWSALFSIGLVLAVGAFVAAQPKASAVEFSPAELDLAPGESYLIGIHVRNPLGKPTKATITLTGDSDLKLSVEKWEGVLPKWGVKLFPRIRASVSRSQDGFVTVRLVVAGKTVSQGRALIRHTVPVADLVADWPSQCVVFKITNTYKNRRLKGGVRLSNPDRFLQDVTTGLFDAAPGQTVEVRFPVPGASPAEGETYRFTAVYRTWEGYTGRIVRDLVFENHPWLHEKK
ncbi:MAG: hypothetical protein ACUVTZ_01175 [Armatimonadota bacterium]